MKKIVFVLFELATNTIYVKAASTLNVVELSVEGRKDLLGLDLQHPRLSWEIESTQRGIMQTAYQIIVASSMDNLMANRGDVWNKWNN